MRFVLNALRCDVLRQAFDSGTQSVHAEFHFEFLKFLVRQQHIHELAVRPFLLLCLLCLCFCTLFLYLSLVRFIARFIFRF